MSTASIHKPSVPTSASPPGATAGDRSRWWWGVLLVFAVTFAAYAPIFSAGLIWNDSDYVTRPELTTLAGLKRIWFEFGATEQYYPLLHSAFWLEHRLWGDAPRAYHFANVALHALAACLFAQVLIQLFALEAVSRNRNRRSSAIAWFAALLFALHPVAVESVAWISEQKNTLSTVFYLGAAWTYLRFYQGVGWSVRGYLWATFLFVLALLTKSLTATLPGALCVALWWARGSVTWKRDLRPLLPWFVLGGAMGLLSGWVEKTYVGAQGAVFDLNFLQRLLLSGRVIWFYLGRIVWPPGWIFIYPRWKIDPAISGSYLFPAGVALLLVAAAWIRKSRSAPLAALLIFLGSLLPTIGLFNVYGFLFSYVADHWVYLPALAILALAAGVWPSLDRFFGRAAAFVVLTLFAVLTWRQTHKYHDAETLYRSILERNPAAWLAHNNLGIILSAQGAFPQAILEYQAALQLYPSNEEAHNNLGAAFLRSGRVAEALSEFDSALRLAPAFAEAHNNRGSALERLGRPGEAEAEYETALKLKPAYAEPQINLGTLFLHANRVEEAVSHYHAALAIDRESAEAHCNLGTAWEREGRFEDAIAQYREALRINPALAEAHNDLGNALLKEKHFGEAVSEDEIAAKLAPTSIAIRANLGLALGYAGRFSEAAEAYREVLKLDPENTTARLQMEKAERMAKAR